MGYWLKDIGERMFANQIKRNRPVRKLYLRGFSAIALVLLIIAGGQQASAQESALATTKAFVERALQVLADKQTPVAQRQEELRQLLEPRFDFREMSRSTLGYHWKTLSQSQQQNFADVFKSFIEAAYLAKIRDYSGQQVEFLKESSLDQGYRQVFTHIVQNEKAPIPVNYLLEQTSSGWKVYDVTVDNISIIANYRNQFNRVINDKGFDQLVADLKAKQQQLSLTSG
jgi:phospholipid transport system substrate-binding protein